MWQLFALREGKSERELSAHQKENAAAFSKARIANAPNRTQTLRAAARGEHDLIVYLGKPGRSETYQLYKHGLPSPMELHLRHGLRRRCLGLRLRDGRQLLLRLGNSRLVDAGGLL